MCSGLVYWSIYASVDIDELNKVASQYTLPLFTTRIAVCRVVKHFTQRQGFISICYTENKQTILQIVL